MICQKIWRKVIPTRTSTPDALLNGSKIVTQHLLHLFLKQNDFSSRDSLKWEEHEQNGYLLLNHNLFSSNYGCIDLFYMKTSLHKTDV